MPLFHNSAMSHCSSACGSMSVTLVTLILAVRGRGGAYVGLVCCEMWWTSVAWGNGGGGRGTVKMPHKKRREEVVITVCVCVGGGGGMFLSVQFGFFRLSQSLNSK